MDKLFEEVIRRILDNKLVRKVFRGIFDEDDNVYIVFSNNAHEVPNEESSIVLGSVISAEARESMEKAKMAGIFSNCLIDEDTITVKMWFHYNQSTH
jgi:cell division protein YceG involved in septum cleavage